MPPENVEELRKEILSNYDGLSKRLQQVAKYVLDHPNDMALETLAVISNRIGVQPSTIVRFAKALGYDGATPMQRLYRDELLAGQHVLGYRERIRQFKDESSASSTPAAGHLLNEFVDASVLTLEHLRDSISEHHLKKATALVTNANTVFVAGFARSFPVAAYISYALQRLSKRTNFVDGIGGLARQQIGQIAKGDTLIAIGFHPYSREIQDVVNIALERKSKIIGISDSQVSPVVANADVPLIVTDAEVRNFRSLTATLALAQAIVLGYAFETEST